MTHNKKTVAMSTRLPVSLWEVLQQLRLHFIGLNRSKDGKKLPTSVHGITLYALKRLIDEYTIPTDGIMFFDPNKERTLK
tara:strand:- start:3 stop:242 length:240 start_codon:yes stop_codon:yes gene_type:complete